MITRFASTVIVMFIVGAGPSQIHAQGQQPTSPPNQPIELPEFIVTGKSRADIPGGTKRAPNKPPILSGARLDSLNPIEKVPLPSLPNALLPMYHQPILWRPGYLSASLGNYLTADIDAGYAFRAGGYLLDVTTSLEASEGWLPHAEYAMFDLGLMSTYVAPEKFLFFGGSTTIVDVDLANKNYILYADSNNRSRNTFGFDASVETKGAWEGLQYRGAVGLLTRSMNTMERSFSGTSITGAASAISKATKVEVGGEVDVRIRSFGGNAYPYTALSAIGGYADESFLVRARGGIQWATSTTSVDRFGVAISGTADVFISQDATIRAFATTGLRALDLSDLLKENPYIADTAVIEVPYDVVDLGVGVYYHPLTRLNVSVHGSFRATDRDVVWTNADEATFVPMYLSTTTMSIVGDARWEASTMDAIVADLRYAKAQVSGNKATPYIPSIKASVGYDRRWLHQLRSVVTLIFVGDRFADLANTVTLQDDIRSRPTSP
jgi:hypothetical protein